MGDYTTIVDPDTGKCVNLNTPKGMKILKEYIKNGGLNLDPPIASIKLPDTGHIPRKLGNNPSQCNIRFKNRNRTKAGLPPVIPEAWPETKSKKQPKTDDRRATKVNRVNNKNPFRYYDAVIPIDECEKPTTLRSQKQKQRPEGLPAVKLAWVENMQCKGISERPARQVPRNTGEAQRKARKACKDKPLKMIHI